MTLLEGRRRKNSSHSLPHSLGFLSMYVASLVTQIVKNPPAKWETWVRSPGWEDPLKEEIAIHSSILDWEIPRTERACQSMGSKTVRSG